MGRLIEESRVVDILQHTWLNGTIAHRFIDDIKRRIRIEVPTAEAISKADYEQRLKADMVAILTEIQLEIREYHEIGCDEDCNNCRMVGCIEPVNVIKDLDIIQQKINALKEKEDKEA